LSASSQLSCPPDANSAVVYKTAALPARTLCTPVSSGVPARPAQGHGLATDPGHSFAARDRVANVRQSSSVSRTTTGKGIRDSGLQTASFILPAPDRTASPFGADSDWRTGMADMCAVHDAPRLIVLEHRVGATIQPSYSCSRYVIVPGLGSGAHRRRYASRRTRRYDPGEASRNGRSARGAVPPDGGDHPWSPRRGFAPSFKGVTGSPASPRARASWAGTR
jgi:hypothetical protein